MRSETRGLKSRRVLSALLLVGIGFARPSGSQSLSFELDEHGRVVAFADALGRITRYERNRLGHLVRLTYPGGNWSEYQYDAQNRLSRVLTERNHELRYRYDPHGRWSEVRFPNGDTQRFEFSAAGRDLRLTHPDGTVSAFGFDAQGHLERASTASVTLTLRYDAEGRLTSLQRADGNVIGFRFDGTNHLRALADAAGKEQRSWPVTVGGLPDGRLLTVADALDRLEIRRDQAGRLSSATSEWGWKVFVHWDEKTSTPRSLTGPWGYVELDAHGRPRELLAHDGLRVSSAWDQSGRLERMTLPSLGDLQLRYPQNSRLPRSWELAGLPGAVRDLEQRRPDELRSALPRARMHETEVGVRLEHSVPMLAAERLFDAQRDRFWSRVMSLVEASSKLPAPGSPQALARDDYWTSGRYRTDPYYQELEELPELTPANYPTIFALTVGVVALDFARFTIDLASIFDYGIGSPPSDRSHGTSRIPLELRNPWPWVDLAVDHAMSAARTQLRRRMDAMGASLVGAGLDRAENTQETVADFVTGIAELRDVADRMVERGQARPRTIYSFQEKQPAMSILMVSENAIAELSSPSVVEVQHLSGHTVAAFNWLGTLGDTGLLWFRKEILERKIEDWLQGPDDVKTSKPDGWSAVELQLDRTRRTLSATDLLAAPPSAGARHDSARAGVEILRRALEMDRTAIPTSRELEKRRKALIEGCPPDQVTCPAKPDGQP